MALAIDTIDEWGLSNEAHCNKTECFNFKSGRAVRVVKLIKQDWPIVLQ